MGLENPLGLVLWEATLELTAAVDALEIQGANLEHVRIVKADARKGGSKPTESRISRVLGCIVVARASWCGRTSRSTRRASTPWRMSSEAAKSPEGPAPMIKTSFLTSVTAGSQPPGMGV